MRPSQKGARGPPTGQVRKGLSTASSQWVSLWPSWHLSIRAPGHCSSARQQARTVRQGGRSGQKAGRGQPTGLRGRHTHGAAWLVVPIGLLGSSLRRWRGHRMAHQPEHSTCREGSLALGADSGFRYFELSFQSPLHPSIALHCALSVSCRYSALAETHLPFKLQSQAALLIEHRRAWE